MGERVGCAARLGPHDGESTRRLVPQWQLVAGMTTGNASFPALSHVRRGAVMVPVSLIPALLSPGARGSIPLHAQTPEILESAPGRFPLDLLARQTAQPLPSPPPRRDGGQGSAVGGDTRQSITRTVFSGRGPDITVVLDITHFLRSLY